jgi:hypothetical protein
MDIGSLRKLLESVKGGEVNVDDAMHRLKTLPYEDLGFAKLDHHRHLRNGCPEVVFCQSKAIEHVVEIMKRLYAANGHVLGTRADKSVFEAVSAELPEAKYNPMARIISLGEPLRSKEDIAADDNYIMIACAGTADIPVAEEALVTANALGSRVEKSYDVGVAGLHRLLDQKDLLIGANVIIAVAGMEGALASVVGGMVSRPVIAVPTSIGYGASFGGLAALLSMLNSCASGVSVVNIDNGFGAGYLAHMINAGNRE